MCKYYGYIRVSTGTQAEKGIGLDVQRDCIYKYAHDHEITIEKIFDDAGVSGTKETRDSFEELVAVLERGDIVIVQNTNRLWRDIFAEAAILKTLMNIGADFRSYDEPELSIDYVLKNPEGALMFGVMSAIATFQRLEINRKLSRARTLKAHKGDKPAGVCPFGYQYAADKKSVEINQDEAQTVKYIFSEAQKGSSLQKIADKLNEQGIRTRYAGQERKAKNGGSVIVSGQWTRGTIHAMLHNRFYIGELEHAGQTVPGNHDAIISKIQFGKVNAALARKHK